MRFLLHKQPENPPKPQKYICWILETDKSFINRKMGKLMVTLVTHHDGRSERNGMKSITVRARLAASCVFKVLLNAARRAQTVGDQVKSLVKFSWKSLDIFLGEKKMSFKGLFLRPREDV